MRLADRIALLLVLLTLLVLSLATPPPPPPPPPSKTPKPKTMLDSLLASSEDLFGALIPEFGVRSVCDADVKVCPSGARSIRDRNHGCEFTPCEQLTLPPGLAPTEMPNPRKLSSPGWYGHYEFVVPRLRFRDVRLGRDVVRRVDKMLTSRARSCNDRTRRRKDVSLDGEPFFYLGCINLYLIAPSPPRPYESKWARGYVGGSSSTSDALALETLRNALLGDAVTPTKDKKDWMLSRPPTPFVVEADPWTRFAYAARTFATWPPPTDHFEMLVGNELERLMRATGIIDSARGYDAPLLALHVNQSRARDASSRLEVQGAEAFDWDAFGVTSDEMRARVVDLFESRRMALLNYLASVAFLPAAHNKTLEEGRAAHEMVFSSVAMTVFVTRVEPGFCQLGRLLDCAPKVATTTWVFRSTCHPHGFSKRSNNRTERRQREQGLELLNRTASPIERAGRDRQVAYGCSDGGWVFHRAPSDTTPS